jgi:hypothetical protein
MQFKLTKLLILFAFTCLPFSSAWGDNQRPASDDLTFEFYYETLLPLKLKSVTLYTLPSALVQKTDSVFVKTNATNDTFSIHFPSKYPVQAFLLLNYEDMERKSSRFFLDPNRKYWQIFVNDTAAVVHTQAKFSFVEKNALTGIIILIQGAIELLLALVFYKLFRWPSWTLLVVLVANIVSYPVYMLDLHPAYMGDLLMLGIEFLTMFLISRRKLGIGRILILVITLNTISFGFKQLFLLITNVL